MYTIITTVIQYMYKYIRKYKDRRTLSFPIRTGLLISVFVAGDSRRETVLKSLRKPNYADSTRTRGASCDVLDLYSSLSVEIRKYDLIWSDQIRKTQPLRSTVENQLFVSTAESQLLFSKSTNSQQHSLLGMTSSILHPHFQSVFFSQQMVIVISFKHERKTVTNDYAPGLRTWKVQSPTKLNDKG